MYRPVHVVAVAMIASTIAATPAAAARRPSPHARSKSPRWLWSACRRAPTWKSPSLSPAGDAHGAAVPTLDLTTTTPQVSAHSGVLAKPWTQCAVTLLERGRRVWATVGDGLPASGQTSSFTFTKSQTVTLATAVDVSTDKGGFKVGGSVSRTASFSQAFSKSGKKRYYQVETEQGRYKNVCSVVSGGVKSYAYTAYVWRTIQLTGGTRALQTTYSPTWSNCARVAAGTWTRSSSSAKAYTNSAGLDISGLVGFDVSSTSQYDSSNVLRYHQSRPKHVCGSNAVPAAASRIRGKA